MQAGARPGTSEGASVVDHEGVQTDLLWDIARLIATTPTAELLITWRGKVRKVNGRWWIWALFILGFVALAAGMALLFLPLDQPSLFAPGGVLSIAGLALSLGSGVWLLSVRSYRSLARQAGAAAARFWWLLTALFFLDLALLALLLLGNLVYGDLTESVVVLSVLIMVAFACCVLSGAVLPPLLSAREDPKLYQVQTTQFAWALLLVAAVAVAAAVLVDEILGLAQGAPDTNLIVLTVTIALALVSAVIGWYRSSMSRLEAVRRGILGALSEAIDATARLEAVLRTGVRSPAAQSPAAQPMAGEHRVPAGQETREARLAELDALGALRRLQAVVEPGPFRSQSIAALPLAAAFEIVEVVKVASWAIDSRTTEDDLPDSLAHREEHPGELGRPIRDVKRVRRDRRGPSHVLPLLERLHEAILTGLRQPS